MKYITGIIVHIVIVHTYYYILIYYTLPCIESTIRYTGIIVKAVIFKLILESLIYRS